MECSEGVEGVHEQCCPHDLLPGDKHAPGQVCCWCGDVFLSRSDGPHGEYEPGLLKTELKKREAAGRKERRLRAKEEAQHKKDYGG